jgi:hypothetical protein
MYTYTLRQENVADDGPTQNDAFDLTMLEAPNFI